MKCARTVKDTDYLFDMIHIISIDVVSSRHLTIKNRQKRIVKNIFPPLFSCIRTRTNSANDITRTAHLILIINSRFCRISIYKLRFRLFRSTHKSCSWLDKLFQIQILLLSRNARQRRTFCPLWI